MYSFYIVDNCHMIKSNHFALILVPHEVIALVVKFAAHQKLHDELIFTCTTVGTNDDNNTMDEPIAMDHRSTVTNVTYGPFIGLHLTTSSDLPHAHTHRALCTCPHILVLLHLQCHFLMITNLEFFRMNKMRLKEIWMKPMTVLQESYPNGEPQNDEDINHLDATINQLEASYAEAKGGFPDGGEDETLNAVKDGEEPRPDENREAINQYYLRHKQHCHYRGSCH